jgi:N-hydroxyarylamine O-acetyltransferase
MHAPPLDAYFTRIALPPQPRPDLASLHAIQAAHVSAIPFENLDILLGRGVRLDLDALHAKLIAQRRGGYCFEHNTLLLAILRALGYDARPVEARVRTGEARVRPRTHMAIVVRVDDGEWLVDAGFGGEGPRLPVSRRGEVTEDGGLEFRVTREGAAWVLQMRAAADAWRDQYAFLDTAVEPVDFEVANWFTSTHPVSPFVRTLTAQRATSEGRYVLRYPAYTETRGGQTRVREIVRAELGPVLRDVFLIDLPIDTRFPIIDGDAAPAAADSPPA